MFGFTMSSLRHQFFISFLLICIVHSSATDTKCHTVTIQTDDKVTRGIKYLHYELRLFKTSAYDDEITDCPLKIAKNRDVFFEIADDNPEPDVGIRIHSCYATPSNDPKDPNKRWFIKHECSSTLGVNVTINSPDKERRFAIKAFRFMYKNRPVYLHCELKKCSPLPCPRPKCTKSRSRRSLNRSKSMTSQVDVNHVFVSFGPIIQLPNAL